MVKLGVVWQWHEIQLDSGEIVELDDMVQDGYSIAFAPHHEGITRAIFYKKDEGQDPDEDLLKPFMPEVVAA